MSMNRQNNKGETHYSSMLKKINDFFDIVNINNRIIAAKVKCDDKLLKHIFYNLGKNNVAECIAKYLMKYFEKNKYEDKNYNFDVDTIIFHSNDFDLDIIEYRSSDFVNDTIEYYDVEKIKIILEKPYEDDDVEKIKKILEKPYEDDENDYSCLIYKKFPDIYDISDYLSKHGDEIMKEKHNQGI